MSTSSVVGIGMRLLMENALVEVITALILSGVVGIFNGHLWVFLQRGMMMERIMLRYFSTSSLAIKAICAIAKNIMKEDSLIFLETLITPLL